MLTAAAIAAPSALVTLSAAPAAAAKVDLVVSGDDPTVNGGVWVWGGDHYSQLRGLLTSTNFGPDVTFHVDADGMSPLDLDSSVHVFFGGAKDYSAAEENAILDWIRDGGVYIANNNHPTAFDNTSFLPGNPNLAQVGQWEGSTTTNDPNDTHSCPQNVGSNDCVVPPVDPVAQEELFNYINKHSAPAAAEVRNAANPSVQPLVNGPHGSVSEIRNWHTVGVFGALSAHYIEVAHLTTTCNAATDACVGTSGFINYNNSLDGPVVAVAPFGTTGFGKGAAVITSDGDVFSNAYGDMLPGNRNLALNLFQWIGNHFAAQAEQPGGGGGGGGGTGGGGSGGGTTSPAAGKGYWFLGRDGTVYNFGETTNYGSLSNGTPAAAIAARREGDGYWIVDRNGIVHAYGKAKSLGDMNGIPLNAPIIGLEPTPSGNGYWLLASDGGVFSFGDAVFHGSTGGLQLNAPVISMRSTKTGNGYWLLGADGGVFSFGDAVFHGSTGSMKLNAPVISMAVHPNGEGYWLLGADGGVFSFGALQFHGSVPGLPITANAPAVQIRSTATGNGYWLLGADGGVFSFGDAHFFGSSPSLNAANPAVDMAVRY